ncbi:F-box only 6 [Brachionus plicatilis]|uniref:F-box only 6 n=1 Tax=Brachionus plicatilis TaxID=10195 RepID=A0A3M7RRY4_BRAPC|nr:F-box only 6 [Brachionus plicatilis]
MSMNQLPNEILLSILSRLSFHDLVKNASLTCKKWYSLIQSEHFWKFKIKAELGLQLVPGLDPTSLKAFYLKKPFGRNLIRNPCFSSGLDHWSVSDQLCTDSIEDCSYSSSFIIEEHDECSVPAFDENKRPIKKFATSSSIIFKYQLIDLQSEGLSWPLLECFGPSVTIKDSYAGRLYLGYEYYIQVVLYDDDLNELGSISYDEKVSEENWSNSEWKEFVYTFKDCSSSLRFILFIHGGRDATNWTGYYGVKLTNSQVTINWSNE